MKEQEVSNMSEREFNAIFSERLRYYLNKYEITQLELSKRLGVGTTSVYNWCNGIKTPRMDKVDAMCDIFHCKRSDLMIDTTDASKIVDNEQDPDIRRIERARKNMPEEDKKFMMDMLIRSFSEYFEDDGSDDPD